MQDEASTQNPLPGHSFSAKMSFVGPKSPPKTSHEEENRENVNDSIFWRRRRRRHLSRRPSTAHPLPFALILTLFAAISLASPSSASLKKEDRAVGSSEMRIGVLGEEKSGERGGEGDCERRLKGQWPSCSRFLSPAHSNIYFPPARMTIS